MTASGSVRPGQGQGLALGSSTWPCKRSPEGFFGKGKEKDGGKEKGGKGPLMSASRRAELFGGPSPSPPRERSRKRSRSRRRRSPSGSEEPKKRLPRGSNFS